MEAAEALGPILGRLLSPVNEERRNAEAEFEEVMRTAPEKSIWGLLVVCGDWTIPGLQRQDGRSCCGAPSPVRSLCGVLLRRNLVREWARLSGEVQTAVKASFVASFTIAPPRTDPDLGRTLGECASALATHLTATSNEDGGLLGPWPDLGPAVLGAIGADDTRCGRGCDAAYRLARDLDDPSGMLRKAFAETLREAVGKAVRKQDFGTLRRAIRALGSVVRCGPCDDDSDLDQLGGPATIEALIAGAVDVPSSVPNSSANLRDGLEILVEVAEDRPFLLRRAAPGLCGTALRIAHNDDADAARSLAVELVATLAESAPAMMRKVRIAETSFAEAAVAVCARLLCTLDDEDRTNDFERAMTDDNDVSESSLRDLGGEALDRICRALRPRTCLPFAADAVRKLLASGTADPAQRWPDARAAFTALVQLAEGFKDLEAAPGDQQDTWDLIPYFVVDRPPAENDHKKGGTMTKKKKKKHRKPQADVERRAMDLAETCVPFATRYPAAQVRREAMDAIAQTASDFAPEFAQTCHAVVMPALCNALTSDPVPRCRAAAGRALLNMLAETTAPFFWSMYFEPVAEALRKVITDPWANPPMVRGVAVATLAALADGALGRDGAESQLYSAFAPSLTPLVLERTVDAGLRARALECLALLGCAAGKEKFQHDAVEIVNVVARDYFNDETRRPEDDPERPAALKCAVRVATCLEADFEPFLATVVPALLRAADPPDEDIIVDTGERLPRSDDLDDDHDVMDFTNLDVRTEAFEEQASACHLVTVLADALGPRFAKHAPECLTAVGGVASSAIADDVRIYAVAAIPHLVSCVAFHDHDESIKALGGPSDSEWCYDPSNVRTAAVIALDALDQALQYEEDGDVRIAILQAIRQTLEDASRIVDVYEDPVKKKKTAPGTNRVDSPRSCVPLLLGTRFAPEALFRTLLAAERGVIQRRAMRYASAQVDVDYDDDRAHEDKAEGLRDQETQFHVAEAVGAVLRTHGAAAVAGLGPTWAERLRDLAAPQCLEDDKKIAAYILADVFEFGIVPPRGDFFPGAGTLAFRRDAFLQQAKDQCLPFLDVLASLAATNVDSPATAPRRQAAMYGLGFAGLHAGDRLQNQQLAALFNVFAQTMLATTRPPLVVSSIGDDADDDDDDWEDDDDDVSQYDRECVGDNAAAALYKALAAHGGRLGDAGAAVWTTWLEYLPLRADAEEADATARALCATILEDRIPSTLASKAFQCLARIAYALHHGGECGTTACHKPPAAVVLARLSKRQAQSGLPIGHQIVAALRKLQGTPGALVDLQAPLQQALETLVADPSVLHPPR